MSFFLVDLNQQSERNEYFLILGQLKYMIRTCIYYSYKTNG